MEWLTDSPWLAWIAIALILAAIEAATVDFVFVMLAGGALAGALTAGLGGGLAAQVVIAVAVAALLLAVIRPIIRRHFVEGEVDHGIETVTETNGRIKLGGATWSARVPAHAESCPPGSDVQVIALHGATAIVVAAPHPVAEPT